MKEQFKQDLRQRQEFLKKVQNLRSQQNILKAIEGMKMEDDTDEWIRKLDEETAFREAKMEMALENAPKEAETHAPDPGPEMEKLIAEEMVRKMKEQMAAEKSGAGHITPSNKPLVDLDAPSADEKPTTENPDRKMLDGVE